MDEKSFLPNTIILLWLNFIGVKDLDSSCSVQYGPLDYSHLFPSEFRLLEARSGGCELQGRILLSGHQFSRRCFPQNQYPEAHVRYSV